MDTSEIYIKMCDCEEVQSRWKVEVGDWFFCTCKDLGTFYPMGFKPNGFGLQVLCEGDADLHNEKLINSPTDVWLPRQDQIQEMILPLGYRIQAQLLYELTNFSRQSRDMNGEYLYPSFEQLWLAFYMYEKHSKVWTGEKWLQKK